MPQKCPHLPALPPARSILKLIVFFAGANVAFQYLQNVPSWREGFSMFSLQSAGALLAWVQWRLHSKEVSLHCPGALRRGLASLRVVRDDERRSA